MKGNHKNNCCISIIARIVERLQGKGRLEISMFRSSNNNNSSNIHRNFQYLIEDAVVYSVKKEVTNLIDKNEQLAKKKD